MAPTQFDGGYPLISRQTTAISSPALDRIRAPVSQGCSLCGLCMSAATLSSRSVRVAIRSSAASCRSRISRASSRKKSYSSSTRDFLGDGMGSCGSTGREWEIDMGRTFEVISGCYRVERTCAICFSWGSLGVIWGSILHRLYGSMMQMVRNKKFLPILLSFCR